MTKNVFISFRAEATLRDRIRAMAGEERRTLSQMAIILLDEALKDRQCREMIRKAEGRPQTVQEFEEEIEEWKLDANQAAQDTAQLWLSNQEGDR